MEDHDRDVGRVSGKRSRDCSERVLELPLGAGEPASGRNFRALATRHTFGRLIVAVPPSTARSRALVSVTYRGMPSAHSSRCGASYGSALRNGVTKDEIVELVIHLEALRRGCTRLSTVTRIALQVFRWKPVERAGAADRE